MSDIQLLPQDSQYDIILRWYQSDDDNRKALTTKQEDMLRKWELAHDLFQQYGINETVVNMLVSKYSTEEKKLSRASAYRYLATAKKFFGTTTKLDKDYARVFLWNKNIKGLERAVLRKDSKAEAMFLRNLEKIAGIDKIDSDLPDWRNLVVAQINIVSDPQKVGLEKIENLDVLVAKFMKRKEERKLLEDGDL